MAERWAILNVTFMFEDTVENIEDIQDRLMDAVGEAICPHPTTWATTSPDVDGESLGHECRQMVVGSQLLLSEPTTADEEECPFCGHKDD